MPTILLISNDTAFRHSLHQSIHGENTFVLGVPNTRDILNQPGVRQVSGYDLIVAEILSADHDGLSRLVLFRILHPNTPFIAVTRERQSDALAYSTAAARALHAWLTPIDADSMAELVEITSRAMRGELPPREEAYAS